MSRCSQIPSYRRHRQSGQAIVTLTDSFGNRRDVLLGTYGTVASRQVYARVIAEWEASERSNLPLIGDRLNSEGPRLDHQGGLYYNASNRDILPRLVSEALHRCTNDLIGANHGKVRM